MHELLELILKNITTYPDEVMIEMANEDGREVYTISVHPDDMGRVIGKSGKVIQAIRSLAHVVAIRQNKHFRINLADSGAPAPAATTTPTTQDPVDSSVAEDEAEEDLISGAIDIDSMKEESDKQE
jgi:uncharacterized protein